VPNGRTLNVKRPVTVSDHIEEARPSDNEGNIVGKNILFWLETLLKFTITGRDPNRQPPRSSQVQPFLTPSSWRLLCYPSRRVNGSSVFYLRDTPCGCPPAIGRRPYGKTNNILITTSRLVHFLHPCERTVSLQSNQGVPEILFVRLKPTLDLTPIGP
jgi:hypothetical protein